MSRNEPMVQKEDIRRLVGTCDALLKAGRMSEVTNLIGKLPLNRVPRVSRQDLAKICRRAGLVDTGLRLLFPIIRAEKPLDRAPTPGEIAEYAYLLARNGSRSEAVGLLEKLNPQIIPEALLYHASCLIEGWNYSLAVPLLEKFITLAGDHYQRLIAAVNLSSSYLALGKLAEAEELLTETLSEAEKQGATRLTGNCLELLGNLAIQKSEFQKARAFLERSLTIFANSESRDYLLNRKWLSVIEAFETRSLTPLKDFRHLAISRKHWESVRQTDLFALELEFDQRAFDHLYFGTPSLEFRQAIQKQVPRDVSEIFFLGAVPPQTILDLEQGSLSRSDEPLEPGGKIHELLKQLLADFYLPQSTGSLFAALYPDEFFNVETSPNKVRQLLFRTRRWLAQNSLTADVECDHGDYRFSVGSALTVRIPRTVNEWEFHSLRWQRLTKQFASQGRFNAKSGAELLGLSEPSFQRFKKWALDRGLIAKRGSGKLTYYEIQDCSGSASERKAA